MTWAARREQERVHQEQREDEVHRGGQRQHEDRGAGTVLVLTVMAAALVMTAMAGVIGQVIVARHRAQAAADLAALAGAASAASDSWSALGPVSAGDCQIAAVTARLNGARLRSCRANPGGVVQVGVVVPVGTGGWQAHATARAGEAT